MVMRKRLTVDQEECKFWWFCYFEAPYIHPLHVSVHQNRDDFKDPAKLEIHILLNACLEFNLLSNVNKEMQENSCTWQHH